MKNKAYDILVQIGTTVVDGTVSKSIDFTTDMIDCTTDQSTGHSKEYLPGEDGVTVQFDGKVDEATSLYSVRDLQNAQQDRTLVNWIYGGTASGAETVLGEAYISKVSRSGAKGEAETYSCTLQVTGPVTFGTV